MQIVKLADEALYKVKRKKRNSKLTGRFYDGPDWEIHDPNTHLSVGASLEFESDIKYWLNNGLFTLYYQPIKSCKDGSLSGLEALIRLNHPSGNIWTPNQFIPAIEASSSGLIHSLADYVLTEAIHQAHSWNLQDKFLAVNLTASSLQRPEFITNLDHLLRYYDVPHNCIALEITETTEIDFQSQIISALRHLKSKGIKPELDDFPQGFNSLPTLMKLSDVLFAVKIDKYFIASIDESMDVLELIIAICHKRGLKTVAEGVETEAQLDALTTLGCDLWQGYLSSKPQPASVASGWL